MFFFKLALSVLLDETDFKKKEAIFITPGSGSGKRIIIGGS